MQAIYLLDTNIISELTKPIQNDKIVQKIFETQKISVLSTVTWGESLYGNWNAADYDIDDYNYPDYDDYYNNSGNLNKPNSGNNSSSSNKPNNSNSTTSKKENTELPAPDTRTGSEKCNLFLNCAKAYMGTPYVLGGESKSGIDCSGLIYVAAQHAGLGKLPRTAKTQYSIAQRVSENERQPGDLIFFQSNNTISHVAIYLGNNQVIHSISNGTKTGVVISKLSEKYWKNHYYASGKIFKD